MATHNTITPKLAAQRIIKTKNEAEFVALKTSILRGEHLNRAKLELALRDCMLAVRQIISASKLSDAEKREILQNLSQVPIILEEAKRDQAKSLESLEAAEGNGQQN